MPESSPQTSDRTWRLLNRDGTFNVARTGQKTLRFNDLYHSLLSASWKGFLGLFVSAYFVLNLIFALAYYICGPQALSGTNAAYGPQYFMDCFFFSVQTFATIGYGKMTPVGFAPNIVVTL